MEDTLTADADKQGAKGAGAGIRPPRGSHRLWACPEGRGRRRQSPKGTGREAEGRHGGAGSSLAAFAGETPREARESLLDARQQRQRPVGFPGRPRHQALQGPLRGRGAGRGGRGRARRALPAARAHRQQRAHLLLVAERALPEALLQLPAKLGWGGVGVGAGPPARSPPQSSELPLFFELPTPR